MKIAVIAPTSMLKMCDGRDCHLVLAHRVLQDKEYAHFYRLQKGYKILDNSLMENGHTALPLAQVLEAAKLINADEVVIPDAFRDARGTLELAARNFEWLRQTDQMHLYKWAVVAHGQTPAEWKACYSELVTNTSWPVSVVHIPKVMDELWPGGRCGLLHWLERTFQYAMYKEHHLLGIWTNPLEILQVSGLTWIRSCDTALPVQAGLQGIRFDPNFGLDPSKPKPKRPEGYFDLPHPNVATWKNCKHNVRVLDSFANGHV